MYYYFQTTNNEGQPVYAVRQPDNSLRYFLHDHEAGSYADWLNLIEA